MSQPPCRFRVAALLRLDAHERNRRVAIDVPCVGVTDGGCDALPGWACHRDKSPTSRIVVVACVVRDGRVLLSQRPSGKSFAGLWELPGGKVESDEGNREALSRELLEELGVFCVFGPWEPISEFYIGSPPCAEPTSFVVYRTKILGEPRPLAAVGLGWFGPEFVHLPQTPGNVQMRDVLLAELAK